MAEHRATLVALCAFVVLAATPGVRGQNECEDDPGAMYDIMADYQGLFGNKTELTDGDAEVMPVVESENSTGNVYYRWFMGHANYDDIDFGVKGDKGCCCETWTYWVSYIYAGGYHVLQLPQIGFVQSTQIGSCGENKKCENMDGKCEQVYMWKTMLVTHQPVYSLWDLIGNKPFFARINLPRYCKCNCPKKF